jgi:hypothetical protein
VAEIAGLDRLSDKVSEVEIADWFSGCSAHWLVWLVRCFVQLRRTYGIIPDSAITKLQILELFLPSPVFHD